MALADKRSVNPSRHKRYKCFGHGLFFRRMVSCVKRPIKIYTKDANELLFTGVFCGSHETVLASPPAHAARRSSKTDQIADSDATRCAKSASLCIGPGVNRSRSVPRGTVG